MDISSWAAFDTPANVGRALWALILDLLSPCPLRLDHLDLPSGGPAAIGCHIARQIGTTHSGSFHPAPGKLACQPETNGGAR